MTSKLDDVRLPDSLVATLKPEFRKTLVTFFRKHSPGTLNGYRKWKREQERARKKTR